VLELKGVTLLHVDHIEAQNSLILALKDQMALNLVGSDRVQERHAKEMTKLSQVINQEFPRIREALVASQEAIVQEKRKADADHCELASTKKLLDLAKTKVRILEEELDKALRTSQMLEETNQATRKKFVQIVDFIKDIWQEEVSNSSLAPVMKTISLHNASARPGNHGQTTLTKTGPEI